jgi:hypothetical protein
MKKILIPKIAARKARIMARLLISQSIQQIRISQLIR